MAYTYIYVFGVYEYAYMADWIKTIMIIILIKWNKSMLGMDSLILLQNKAQNEWFWWPWDREGGY